MLIESDDADCSHDADLRDLPIQQAQWAKHMTVGLPACFHEKIVHLINLTIELGNRTRTLP